MKDNIYTIPLTDAFSSDDECPFCFIHRKLEDDAVDFMLGAAYMADDIREKTNETGFCSKHYELMYDHGNRLGMALMLHTHLQELLKGLNPLLKENIPESIGTKGSFLTKFLATKALPNKNNANNSASSYIYKSVENCYICNKINADMARYVDTFFYIWKHDSNFISLVKNCKGFCLLHFAILLDVAPNKLSKGDLENFYQIVTPLALENLNRLEEELSWFIDKYDYRNKSEPWKNSKDAVPRAIQKLSSLYVED